MPSRRRLTAAAVSVLTATGLAAGAPDASAVAPAWRIQQIEPLSGTADYATLRDVAAVSTSSAWGVGEISLQQQKKGDPTAASVVGHWNGSSWQRIAPPSVVTGKDPILVGVRASRAAGVWVVGQAGFGGRGGYHNFVSRRSGDHWVNHDLGAGASRADVRILGANDIWVLYTRTTSSPDVGVGEHWNGRSWTKVRLPALPAGEGSGHWASATAPGSGRRELLHFNGRTWTAVRGPALPDKRPAYYSGLLVRDDSLFVAVGYIGSDDGDSGEGLRIYQRDRQGAWHQRLYLAHGSGTGITRTSAPGLWLLYGYPGQVLHVVGGKVVSASPIPPEVDKAVTRIETISGTASSPVVFGAGDSGYGARSAYGARYLP